MILVDRALKGTEKGLLFITIWKLCTEEFPAEGQKKWSESEAAFKLIQILLSIVVVGKTQNLIFDEEKKNCIFGGGLPQNGFLSMIPY